MRIFLALTLAPALAAVAPDLAFAQQAAPPVVLGPTGGILGTGQGPTQRAVGVAPLSPFNAAPYAAVRQGTAHFGAGTSGTSSGIGNALGGIHGSALSVGTGGINDSLSYGASTGGVAGSGRGLGVGSGGILDTADNGSGNKTGGVRGANIGAGSGGLNDQDSLGASTGGVNENGPGGTNAPRYRRTGVNENPTIAAVAAINSRIQSTASVGSIDSAIRSLIAPTKP